MTKDELIEFVDSYPSWFQRLHLGEDVYTMPQEALSDITWEHLKKLLPENIKGKSVLDIGSNIGFFSYKLKEMGAKRVVAIDTDYFYQAKEVSEIIDGGVNFKRLDAYKVSTLDEKFDIVLFMGIFYHLPDPFLALKLAASVCKEILIIETEVIPPGPGNTVWMSEGYGRDKSGFPVKTTNGFMKFVEGVELNQDDWTNWWVPDTECVMAMLRTDAVYFKNISEPVYPRNNRLLLMAKRS